MRLHESDLAVISCRPACALLMLHCTCGAILLPVCQLAGVHPLHKHDRVILSYRLNNAYPPCAAGLAAELERWQTVDAHALIAKAEQQAAAGRHLQTPVCKRDVRGKDDHVQLGPGLLALPAKLHLRMDAGPRTPEAVQASGCLQSCGTPARCSRMRPERWYQQWRLHRYQVASEP